MTLTHEMTQILAFLGGIAMTAAVALYRIRNSEKQITELWERVWEQDNKFVSAREFTVTIADIRRHIERIENNEDQK